MRDVEALTVLFRRNFPFVVRDDDFVREFFADPKKRVIERREGGALVGASVVGRSTIYMLCVDEAWRGRGIGSALLAESEAVVRSNGFDEVTVGVGDGYLAPGIPARTMPHSETLVEPRLYDELTDEGWRFFEKRGYRHSWEGANCFDMRQELGGFDGSESCGADSIDCPNSVGDTIDGITYRWAEIADIPRVLRCTDDAHEEFTKYYRSEEMYCSGRERVLIAEADGEVCGAVIVGLETEGKGLGSVGCTAVSHAYRGRKIATTMIKLGTKHLGECGMAQGFLGYTYSGLDKLYGASGYKICVFYAMAEKKLG